MCSLRGTGQVSEIENKYKKVDVLVNNAGITKQSRFLDLTLSDFQKTLDVNLLGTFLCLKHISKLMLKNKISNIGRGKIVNVASIRGLENCARKDMVDYSVSKASVINLTKSIAKDLTPLGINVNAVAPAITRTDLVKNLSKEAQKKAVEGSLIKRMADPVEIAKAILFLASEDANYITGEVLVIDGGYNLTQL
jgi:3-oxoacyl-[acyl-carrier protein] reductase